MGFSPGGVEERDVDLSELIDLKLQLQFPKILNRLAIPPNVEVYLMHLNPKT